MDKNQLSSNFKNIADSKNDLLDAAMQYGIIPDRDTMLNEIIAMERKEILAQHVYSITQTQSENGKVIYSTYLPKQDGGRIFRRRNTLAELQDIIVAHYKAMREEIYIHTVFDQWITQKLEFEEIQKASYDRYMTDYQRFFQAYHHPIQKKKFKNITEDDLENFIKSAIRDLALTRKSYAGLRTLILGIFKYGKRKKYTSLSITEFFGDLELPKNLFKRKTVQKEKEVFMEDEIPLITGYLREHPDIYNLGILLTFFTGMRVGELSSLKPEDLSPNCIRIRRTEDKFRGEDGKWVVTVKDHAKTDAGHRDLIIPNAANEVLVMILELNPDGEYLFENHGKRIRGNTFNKRLSAVCDKLGMPHRTMHKIRKTYGTTLIDNNVDERFITEQMGHADISTTKKIYYFSNKNLKNKAHQIERAISF